METLTVSATRVCPLRITEGKKDLNRLWFRHPDNSINLSRRVIVAELRFSRSRPLLRGESYLQQWIDMLLNSCTLIATYTSSNNA